MSKTAYAALTGRVKIVEIDPATLAADVAEEMASVQRAALAVESPTAVPELGEQIRLAALHTFDDRPLDGMWLVRDDDGRMLGYGSLELSHWDNPTLAFVFAQVHPDAYHRGVGTLLLDAQIATAQANGRTSLLTFATEGGRTDGFLASRGFARARQDAQRRLQPQRLDYSHVQHLLDEALAAAEGYELVTLDGPASPEVVSAMRAVFEAINDAPLDGVESEPEVFPAERIEGIEAARTARGWRAYRVLARERATGEWAGHTILCVDRLRPGYAVQEDTTVIAAHRGHRLGMALKATMLLWMREVEPGLTMIDTWNASTNAHMIAVNDALGCVVSRRGLAMQLTLDETEQPTPAG